MVKEIGLYSVVTLGILYWGFLTIIAAMEKRYMKAFESLYPRKSAVPLGVAGGLMFGSVLIKFFFPDTISTDHTVSFIGGILLSSLTIYYFSK